MVTAEPDVPYRVRLTGVICQSSVTIYNQIWFTRSSKLMLIHQLKPFIVCPMSVFTAVFILSLTASTIQAPEITDTAHYLDNPTTASVVWESASADVVDINVYSGSTFNEV